MSLALTLDRSSHSPLYRQIAETLISQIQTGQLPPGSRLPTVRALAHQLGVTRLTIHTAYSELQSEGWVEATVGRGTFVADTVSLDRAQLAQQVGQAMTPEGVIYDSYRLSSTPQLRLLSYANPDEALFPHDAWWETLTMRRPDPLAFLRYGSPQGVPALRVALTEWAHSRAIECQPDDIIVTDGASQAISLVVRAMTQPGDAIAVESPTYLGALNLFDVERIRPLGVPLDEEGPSLEALERLIVQERPRFFYTIPTFHNPTGITMSEARREALMALAARHRLLIVEDDVYARLAYDGPPPRPLKARDTQGLVIHIDSLSKILAPGLRIGYLIAPDPLRARLLSLRAADDLGGTPLMQQAAADFLNQRLLTAHVRHVLPIYRERRDALLHALQRAMPSEARWTMPQGGLCAWLTLPSHPCLDDLYRAALERGVSYTPGEVFLPQPDGEQHLRLCFGQCSPEAIREAVPILAELIKQRLCRPIVANPLAAQTLV